MKKSFWLTMEKILPMSMSAMSIGLLPVATGIYHQTGLKCEQLSRRQFDFFLLVVYTKTNVNEYTKCEVA